MDEDLLVQRARQENMAIWENDILCPDNHCDVIWVTTQNEYKWP